MTPRSKTQDATVSDVCHLGDAVRLIAEIYDIAPEAIVEFYPARFDPYGVLRQPGGIFAYQFFDTKGGNCAYWLYDLNSVHVFATPRQWSLPKTELIDVGRYLHKPLVHSEPPPADFEDGPEAAVPVLDGCR